MKFLKYIGLSVASIAFVSNVQAVGYTHTFYNGTDYTLDVKILYHACSDSEFTLKPKQSQSVSAGICIIRGSTINYSKPGYVGSYTNTSMEPAGWVGSGMWAIVNIGGDAFTPGFKEISSIPQDEEAFKTVISGVKKTTEEDRKKAEAYAKAKKDIEALKKRSKERRKLEEAKKMKSTSR